MLDIKNKVEEICLAPGDDLPESIINTAKPVLIRGFINHWPLVKAGKTSNDDAFEYLSKAYNGQPITAYYAQPEAKGRIFYNSDFNGFNFQSASLDLHTVLSKLNELKSDPEPPAVYVGSTNINRHFPELNLENKVNIAGVQPITNLWLGNRTKISAHFDFPNNLACCAVGQRRFILFPPEQVKNLYVGPKEASPGGQDISLVDFDQPDLVRYPKFQHAIDNAFVANLEAGDALFIPSMWWHHVEGLTDFNVLITHWWRNSSAFMGKPDNALDLAILSLRNLPYEQRQAWKAIFEHYVFDHNEEDIQHIPNHAQGCLTLPMPELEARKLRAKLLEQLKR
ncbi:cupin-like domain-containing protein [Psychrosphaera sp. 1_MG-2023]|uniref:cupin-like domain-containing protein n=1 Tax=Psychrosphaera sp. 1_MG-2023 TaxID=3062643 RepID=UPI0026E22A72|nr:cupin-like domain-containing protein [Psychrosphaera sp. 1_MG-2023]MDO6718465.1 cupin-like domain-containing protein [Psychrosphaera sp. 1_MG-2023]